MWSYHQIKYHQIQMYLSWSLIGCWHRNLLYREKEFWNYLMQLNFYASISCNNAGHIWIMKNINHFTEDSAFLLYLESRVLGHETYYCIKSPYIYKIAWIKTEILHEILKFILFIRNCKYCAVPIILNCLSPPSPIFHNYFFSLNNPFNWNIFNNYSQNTQPVIVKRTSYMDAWCLDHNERKKKKKKNSVLILFINKF